MRAGWLLLAVCIASVPVVGFSEDRMSEIWEMKSLSAAPTVFPADEFTERAKRENVSALFYEGPAYHGKPTRVFAWVGFPKRSATQQSSPQPRPGEKFPAIILVHGGLGTAYEKWVQLWNSRGYAAIAMDVCGSVPTPAKKKGQWRRHEFGGPPGWGGFDQMDEPIHDQWTYHAVADVILANSLLRSYPDIDPERIGITGISWGGLLTCIVAGIDDRLKFAAPVYGCGYLAKDSPAWRDEVSVMGKEQSERWLKLWDPSQYLPQVKMPMLWVDGTNDFAFPLDSLQKSYRLPPGDRWLTTRVRMVHGHGGPGENPEEIHAFAEAVLNHRPPLAQIAQQGREGKEAWVKYKSNIPIVSAELNFTKDSGEWEHRHWETIPAHVKAESQKVIGDIPSGATVYYFNLIDQRKLIVSSEHVEISGE
jgi:cephalosporin-C deacetylase-like acetyl esterase